jgi:hypothetical protein
MIDLRTVKVRRSAVDGGIGDSFLTLTMRNATIRHGGHCMPLWSYSAYFDTR